jgi:hypothetical protein
MTWPAGLSRLGLQAADPDAFRARIPGPTVDCWDTPPPTVVSVLNVLLDRTSPSITFQFNHALARQDPRTGF